MLNTRSPAHSQTSLPSLPAHLQSDTHLTAHLASRFHVGQCTATLSSSALITLNNYKSSAKGPDGGKDGSAMGGAEDLARRIWSRLGSRAESQAVVFLYVPLPWSCQGMAISVEHYAQPPLLATI